MASVNKVILIGNLTRDPEVRYTPKGTAVGDIALACNRKYRDANEQMQEEVTYVDVTLWGKQAELAKQYLAKGRQVYIEGRLQLDSWQDKESGQNRSKLKVIGETMQFLGTRGDAPPPGGGQPGQQQPYQQQPAAPRAQQPPAAAAPVAAQTAAPAQPSGNDGAQWEDPPAMPAQPAPPQQPAAPPQQAPPQQAPPFVDDDEEDEIPF